ncbi:MAG: Gfo/Idh/MocA family protein [Halobacteriaceae archaeon]
MQEATVGVVGAGWMATDYHIPAYRAHGGSRVVAVAELNPDRRRAVAEEFGLAGYADVESMLAGEDLDVVSICTPPSTHRDVFLAAVEAGCHVFCEKPLTVDAASAAEMRDAAEASGVVTQVGYNARYYENTKRVVAMVRADLLGELVEARTVHHSTPPSQSWYYDPAVSGGGVLRDLGPHLLDVHLELFGTPEVSRSRTRRVRTEAVEDAVDVGLEFDGVPVTLSVSWSQPDVYSRTSVVGTDGWVEYDQERLEGAIHGRDFEFRHGESPLVDLGVTSLFGATSDDAQTERIHDFVDHVLAGDPDTAVPASRGATVVELIDDIYAEAGEPA